MTELEFRVNGGEFDGLCRIAAGAVKFFGNCCVFWLFDVVD